ncbi:hypothetical protein [Janthinobacterium sp. HH01]|uniref:hypothetical protein n=1 Tax=Janthinobacterium sp. HH01 TaxID=1198452 RepID=UPI000346C4AB|nr:hypothetical protein [Janthinobacterium sp. HH01]
MNRISKSLVKVAVAAGSALAAGAAFAVDPPTSATALAQSIDLSDAKGAGLVVIGLLVGIGVTLWGASMIAARFKPKAG